MNPLRTTYTFELIAAPSTEVCAPFLKGMIDAMGLSFFKYGAVAEGYPKNVDAINSLKVRLARYEETGNTRWLVDIANYAMIEFMHPRHPDAHMPEDDAQSPGRVNTAGRLTEEANTPSQEAIRKPSTAPSWQRHSGD